MWAISRLGLARFYWWDDAERAEAELRRAQHESGNSSIRQ
jgi:hypothetical protein